MMRICTNDGQEVCRGCCEQGGLLYFVWRAGGYQLVEAPVQDDRTLLLFLRSYRRIRIVRIDRQCVLDRGQAIVAWLTDMTHFQLGLDRYTIHMSDHLYSSRPFRRLATWPYWRWVFGGIACWLMAVALLWGLRSINPVHAAIEAAMQWSH